MRQASTNLGNYRFGEDYIGRLNEDSALTSAHPDDCALFVGPPRLEMIGELTEALASSDIFKLFGTFQGVNFSNAQSVAPMKAIGSSRYFFFTTNQPVTFGFSLIMMKVDNLLKTIYNNFLAFLGDKKETTLAPFKGYTFNSFRDLMWFDIGGELFSIPFGLGILWSNKERSFLGSAYIESAMMANYSTDIVAGRQMIIESGSFIGDRIRPFDIGPMFEATEEAGSFIKFREEVQKYFTGGEKV